MSMTIYERLLVYLHLG